MSAAERLRLLDVARDLVYKETGIYCDPSRYQLLESRLQRRMAALGGPNTLAEYVVLLWNEPAELSALVEEITVNETYFFRDYPQLRGFAEQVLPRYLDGKRERRDFQLSVWSAACSTGEEPYTLSIILQEMIPDFANWQASIRATDIDRRVLAAARTGRYGERSLKDTPVLYRQNYFRPESDDQWQVSPQVTRLVRFSQLNLRDSAAMAQMRGYDFIFCRNVLIYFDEQSRKQTVEALHDALTPGGHIFLGHSESVGRITNQFELRRYGHFLSYARPEA